jgi:hypothetical protein
LWRSDKGTACELKGVSSRKKEEEKKKDRGLDPGGRRNLFIIKIRNLPTDQLSAIDRLPIIDNQPVLATDKNGCKMTMGQSWLFIDCQRWHRQSPLVGQHWAKTFVPTGVVRK